MIKRSDIQKYITENRKFIKREFISESVQNKYFDAILKESTKILSSDVIFPLLENLEDADSFQDKLSEILDKLMAKFSQLKEGVSEAGELVGWAESMDPQTGELHPETPPDVAEKLRALIDAKEQSGESLNSIVINLKQNYNAMLNNMKTLFDRFQSAEKMKAPLSESISTQILIEAKKVVDEKIKAKKEMKAKEKKDKKAKDDKKVAKAKISKDNLKKLKKLVK